MFQSMQKQGSLRRLEQTLKPTQEIEFVYDPQIWGVNAFFPEVRMIMYLRF